MSVFLSVQVIWIFLCLLFTITLFSVEVEIELDLQTPFTETVFHGLL